MAGPGFGAFISLAGLAKKGYDNWSNNKLARQRIEEIFRGMLDQTGGVFSNDQTDVTIDHLRFVTTEIGSEREGKTFRVEVINTTLAATDRKQRRVFHYNTHTKVFRHR